MNDIGGRKIVNVGAILKKIGVGGRKIFINGNQAVALGAFVAGCRFYAGYPITPSSETLHRMAEYLNDLKYGIFYQPEDELAAIGMIIGASVNGKKSMTATSGPGLSLMQEELGWAIINEIPLFVMNAMRIGPSTGQPTKPASADINCIINGRHGDAGNCVVVLSPSSVQECFELTIKAFNLAEQFRTPVFLAIDGYISNLCEYVYLPSEVEVFDRITSGQNKHPFGFEGNVSDFFAIGRGEGLAYAGLIHDRFGKRSSFSSDICHDNVAHILKKMGAIRFEKFAYFYEASDCDSLFIGYGLSGRAVRDAVIHLRNGGEKVGMMNLGMIWPIDGAINELYSVKNAKKIIIVENNTGQLFSILNGYFKNKDILRFNKWNGKAIQTSELLNFYYSNILNKNVAVVDTPILAVNKDSANVSLEKKEDDTIKVKKEYFFCPGCGHRSFCKIFLPILSENGLNKTNTIFASGIGCGSILATTFNADVIKTSHGRMLNAARTNCLLNPDKMVIAISGDGDIVNIGGNALIHTAREKDKFPMICVCLDNSNYGMTGAQQSATTMAGGVTSTPSQKSFDLKKLLYDGCDIDFFACTSVFDKEHLQNVLREAIDFVRTKKSFAFIRVLSPCTTHFAKNNKDLFSADSVRKEYGVWRRNK